MIGIMRSSSAFSCFKPVIIYARISLAELFCMAVCLTCRVLIKLLYEADNSVILDVAIYDIGL